MLSLILLCICLALSLYFWRFRHHDPKAERLPPGPPPDLFIGHVRHIPLEYSWKYYTQLKDRYGDVVHLSAFGNPIIILNSYKAVNDLLVLRASTYSDRPRSVMAGQIMGIQSGVSFSPYGEWWRAQRRLLHASFNKHSALQSFGNLIEEEVRAYIIRLHQRPDHFLDEFRLTSVKIIMRVTYDIEVDSIHNEYVDRNDEFNKAFLQATAPGAFLVDMFPSLMHVPNWFPGTGWKRLGKQWSDLTHKMIQAPYVKVKRDMANGTAAPSFTSRMIEEQTSGIAVTEEFQMWLSGEIYGAGVDTIHAFVDAFILAMVLHPDIQRQAQDEIDRTIGKHKLPDLQDKELLPYIEALFKEVLRWQAMTPVGIPHRLIKDDQYEGFFLPKGSTIIANSWAISRDPLEYPDPNKFNPDRFMTSKPDGDTPMDPRLYVFGYGRRSCPGKDFAELVTYMAMVSLLSTTNVLKPLDEHGNEYAPEAILSGTVISTPAPFKCRVEPRFPESLEMVHESLGDTASLS